MLQPAPTSISETFLGKNHAELIALTVLNSPVTLDVYGDLNNRVARSANLINSGLGNVQVELDMGDGYGDPFTLNAYETFISIDDPIKAVRLTRIGADANLRWIVR